MIKNQIYTVLRTLKNMKPLMTENEIEVIKKILCDNKPKKCLEWGAGSSTIYFNKYVDKKTKWTAIEHDKKWAVFIKILTVLKKNIKIVYIPVNHYPWSDENNDGAYCDLKDYVDYPNEKYDFILIDGRARSDCLKRAHDLINYNGVVVLHDASRKYYHENTTLFKHSSFVCYNESLKHHGLWVGIKLKP